MADPSWGVILVFGLGTVFVSLAIMMVISYPTFSIGLLAGMILQRLVRIARRFGRQHVQLDLKTGPKEISSRREDASRTDGRSS